MLFFQILFSMLWIYYIYMIYFGIMYWSNVASENWEFYPRSPSRLKKQAYFSYQLLHKKNPNLEVWNNGLLFVVIHFEVDWVVFPLVSPEITHAASFSWWSVRTAGSLSPYALLLRYDISRHCSKRVKETEWSKFYPWKLMSSATFLLAETSHKSKPFKE